MPRTLPTDGPIDLVQNTRKADITEHWLRAGVVLCGTRIGQWQAVSTQGRNRRCKRCARVRDASGSA